MKKRTTNGRPYQQRGRFPLLVLVIYTKPKMQYLCGFEAYKTTKENRPLWWFCLLRSQRKKKRKIEKSEENRFD